MDKINIRNITPNDVSELRDFVNNCKPLGLNTGLAYWMIGMYFNDFSYIIENEGKIIGFSTVLRSSSKNDTLFFWQIGIHKDYRRQNLAQQLLDKVITNAKANGIKYIEFSIFPDNSASLGLCKAYCDENKINIENLPDISFHDPVNKENFTQLYFRITMN